MTEFIKILLGSEDVVIRDNEDEFLNIELSRIAKEVKPDNVSNDFDLGDRYVKERNESLKFCVYGIVESKYSDCTNVTMKIKTSDNDTLYTPKISSGATVSKSHSIKTIPVSKNGSLSKNVYGKERASYFFLFEISRESLDRKIEITKNAGRIPKTDKVIITIDDPVKKIFDVIEVPFIFYDENGDFIQYGTKTTDVNEDGSLVETDNDFPFFYDRHWIKDIVIPSKLADISFRQAGTVTLVPENITGGTFTSEVILDFPSKLGRESVTVILDTDETIRNPNSDFTFTPQTLSWKVGEVSKRFNVGIIDDKFVEANEKLTFRLDNITNAQLNEENDGKFSIAIKNDDIPSIVNFKTTPTNVSESAGTFTFEIFFDKPIEVPGQSVDVIIDATGTTAVLETDFILNASSNRPGATNRTLLLKEGDTGATFSIALIDDLKYELDKTLTLRLANPTQNIEIGGQTPTVTITITDSMAKKFTRYVFPASFQSGTGAFRVNRKVGDEKYEFSIAGNNAAFTNSFPFVIEVFNLGEPVVFGGKLIDGVGSPENQRLVFSKSFTTGITSNLVLDLPANDTLDANNRAFKNTKYQFVFSDIFSNVNVQTEGIQVFNSNQYDDVKVTYEVKPAADSGQSIFYLISEITNIKSAYDANNNGCRTSVDTATSNIKINGIAFLPKTSLQFNQQAFNQATYVTPLFRNRPIQNHCDFNGLLLPFGFGPAADPPFAERSINLSFRDIFVQVDNLPNNNSNLILASRVGSPSTDLLKGFYKWSDASQRTKDEIEMHITNLGSKNVKILGNDAGGGDTVIIKQSDVRFDFSRMNIVLEGNTTYVLSANSFNDATYAISLKNVNFYDRDEKFIKGPVEFNIQLFKFSASTQALGVPEYVLVSQYEDITLGSNGFGQNLCTGSVFDTTKDIKVKGMLLNNSKTDFVGATFSKISQDIIPSCPTSPFEHLILNP
jgi:hypothetical protein